MSIEGNNGNPTPYRPLFLGPDEKGVTNDGVQSVNEPQQFRDVKLEPGSFLAYEAKIDDLRLMVPYLFELKKHLGDTAYILQFRSQFSLDSVPDEFRHKESSLLWRVKFDEVLCYVTDSDRSTFYFPSRESAVAFVKKLSGAEPGPALEDVTEQRNNLRKLLW